MRVALAALVPMCVVACAEDPVQRFELPPQPLACEAAPAMPTVTPVPSTPVPAEACSAHQVDGELVRAVFFTADGVLLGGLSARIDGTPIRQTISRDDAGRVMGMTTHALSAAECDGILVQRFGLPSAWCARAGLGQVSGVVVRVERDALGRVTRIARDTFARGIADQVADLRYQEDGDVIVVDAIDLSDDEGPYSRVTTARHSRGRLIEERSCHRERKDTFELGFIRVLSEDGRSGDLFHVDGRRASETFDDGHRRLTYTDALISVEERYDDVGRPVFGAGVGHSSEVLWDDARQEKTMTVVETAEAFVLTDRFGRGHEFVLEHREGERRTPGGPVIESCPGVSVRRETVPTLPAQFRWPVEDHAQWLGADGRCADELCPFFGPW